MKRRVNNTPAGLAAKFGIPRQHRWSGRTYTLHAVKMERRHADALVKSLHKKGYYAIRRRAYTKYGDMWAVYKKKR